MTRKAFNKDLIDFIDSSPTPFHAVTNIRCLLKEAGFEELRESKRWKLKIRGKYFVVRNGSSIAAFQLSSRAGFKNGFRLVGAHTDSPCLKLKPNTVRSKHGYQQLAVEVYGGVLMNPWFDRDLSIAGKVIIRTSSTKLSSLLLDFKRPVATIPSLAIHLDRDANNKRHINPQTMLVPVVALTNKTDVDLNKLIRAQLKIEHGLSGALKIIDSELFLYDFNKGSLIGLQEEFVASARLDNLLSCFVGLRSLIDAGGDQNRLLICNDHEEIGSGSNIGAKGTFLKAVLERIVLPSGSPSEIMASSMLVSTDNAHAVHPNFPDKHDVGHLPILNSGPVIKVNSNQAYATNSETAAIIKHLAEREKIELQSFVSRNDIGCGSTIGPLTAMTVGVKTVDLGVPTFAMHSIRELAGVEDSYSLFRLLKAFYKAPIVDIEPAYH